MERPQALERALGGQGGSMTSKGHLGGHPSSGGSSLYRDELGLSQGQSAAVAARLAEVVAPQRSAVFDSMLF
jgi:hypothetical protein